MHLNILLLKQFEVQYVFILVVLVLSHEFAYNFVLVCADV